MPKAKKLSDTFEVAFTQNCGRAEYSQEDALWNGIAAHQSKEVLPHAHLMPTKEPCLLSVADGLTVSPYPHLASSFVVKALVNNLKGFPKGIEGLNPSLLRLVHSQLCDKYAKGKTLGSATTIVAALIEGERCRYINAGDSRIYRMAHKEKTLTLLSRDHTEINRLRDDGEAEEEMEYAGIYNMLVSCLSADDEEFDFPIHAGDARFSAGDLILLCSDGVHDVLNHKIIESLCASKNQSAFELVTAIREAIFKVGATDNFSIVVAKRI